MGLYKVRPFHGQCVHSKHGLEQGRYLDEFHLEADSEADAKKGAMAIFLKTHGMDPNQVDIDEENSQIIHMLAYYDSNDLEIPVQAYMELVDSQGEGSAHYLYEYVDFSEVKRVK